VTAIPSKAEGVFTVNFYYQQIKVLKFFYFFDGSFIISDNVNETKKYLSKIIEKK